METKAEAVKDGRPGVRMRNVNVIMILIACVFASLMLFAVYGTVSSYQALQENTRDYIAYQQDAANMQAGSDYLTAQVRVFAVMGETQRVANFQKEIEVTRRRELALEHIGESLSGTETYQYLSEAMESSNELVKLEYYSIRLAAEGYGYDLSTFPESVQQVELTGEDKALSAEEKIEKAQALVFDNTYQQRKDEVSRYVNLCTATLVEQSQQEQTRSSERLLLLLRVQEALLVLLLVSAFMQVYLNHRLVIHPLLDNIDRIEEQELLRVDGAYELKYLARTYNRIFEQTQQHQDKLSYEASHDPLTGLYNRGLFEKMRASMDQQNSALILVDLDYFKEINDNYGHDTGDAALKKVASILQSSFRSEDHVCRIGGDEFAVIMVHANSELRDLVYSKIMRANEKLLNPTDGLPAFSLSVGVAFGDRENPTDDIFKDADTALYRVKESGKNGCAFY